MPPARPDASVRQAGGLAGIGAPRQPREAQGLKISPPGNQKEEQAEAQVAAARGGKGSEAEGTLRSPRNDALEALLADLGSQVRRPSGQSFDAPDSLFDPTGITSLDARLGGGFPRGRLSEISGPASSGRTSIALSLLAETLARGVLAAWIDLADAFDPLSAAASLQAHHPGTDFRRLLWVRARTEEEALRSCDRLLQTEGFELLVFDLPPRGRPGQGRPGRSRKNGAGIRDVSWLRLARLAARTRTSLVVISESPVVSPGTSPGISPGVQNDLNLSVTGSRADLVLEMQPQGALFTGQPPLLATLETHAVLRRHRSRPIGQEVPLSIDAESEI